MTVNLRENLIILLLLTCLSLSSCNNDPHNNDDYETINAGDFNEIITFEDEVLASPGLITTKGKDKLAVLDAGHEKVVVVSTEGEKDFSFGGYGGAAGEWGAEASPANMSLSANRNSFMISDPGHAMIHLYDSNGNSTRSLPLNDYLHQQDITLLVDDMVLAVTNGEQNSLAQAYEITEDMTPITSYGTPLTEPVSDTGINMHEIRDQLANGTVPDALKNEAIADGSNDQIAIILNSLGEVLLYDINGELKWRKELPAYVSDPLWQRAIAMNEEIPSSDAAYSPLQMATGIEIMNNKVYVLTMGTDDDDEIDQFMLIYSTDGQLVDSYRIKDEEGVLALADFIVMPDETIYFTDFANAELLKFDEL